MNTKAKSKKRENGRAEAPATEAAGTKRRGRMHAEDAIPAKVAVTETVASPAEVSSPAPVAPVIYLQYAGGETDLTALTGAASAEFTAAHPDTVIRELKLYVKPEENAAYPVVNGEGVGKLCLRAE